MTEDEQVEELEKKGRLAFKTYCERMPWCKVTKESKDRWSPWDVAFTSGTTRTNIKIVGEIKYREYESNVFEDWILQVDKLNGLKDIQSKYNDVKIMYINIFQDNIITIWDLDNLNEQQQFNLLLSNNQYNDQSQINKNIIKLNYQDAILKDTVTEIFNDGEDKDNLPF